MSTMPREQNLDHCQFTGGGEDAFEIGNFEVGAATDVNSSRVGAPVEIGMVEGLQEKFFAQTLLTVSAGKTSAAIDSFASWLLAGFAAALTFLLGNLDSLGSYLPVAALRESGLLFAFALVPAAIEKLISVVVVAASEAAALARDIGKATAEQEIELDLPLALREFERGFFPPLRWLIGRSVKKIETGDIAASGRNLSKLTQVQGGAVLIQVVLLIWAAIALVGGLAI